MLFTSRTYYNTGISALGKKVDWTSLSFVKILNKRTETLELKKPLG